MPRRHYVPGHALRVASTVLLEPRPGAGSVRPTGSRLHRGIRQRCRCKRGGGAPGGSLRVYASPSIHPCFAWFSAELTLATLAAIRCETSVDYVSFNARVTLAN